MPSLLPMESQGRFYLRATNVNVRIIVKESPMTLKFFSSFKYFLAVLKPFKKNFCIKCNVLVS